MKRGRGLSQSATVLILFIGIVIMGFGVFLRVTAPPAPSYPPDRWEILWYKYSEDLRDPWGDYITKSQLSDWNFDFNYSDGEVADTGEYDLVGLRASRTLTVSDRTKYRFVLGSDDGIRLFIYDSNFNEVTHITTGWRDQAYTVYSYQQTLDKGEYKLLLEWYEHFDGALITFNMTSIG